MFERIVHWLIFLAVVAGVIGAVVQLVTTGSVQFADPQPLPYGAGY